MLAGPLSILISWHRVQLTHLFKSGTPGQSAHVYNYIYFLLCAFTYKYYTYRDTKRPKTSFKAVGELFIVVLFINTYMSCIYYSLLVNVVSDNFAVFIP